MVGRRSSLLGRYSEELEALADKIGANHIYTANSLYMLGGRLREEAIQEKERFQGGS